VPDLVRVKGCEGKKIALIIFVLPNRHRPITIVLLDEPNYVFSLPEPGAIWHCSLLVNDSVKEAGDRESHKQDAKVETGRVVEVVGHQVGDIAEDIKRGEKYIGQHFHAFCARQEACEKEKNEAGEDCSYFGRGKIQRYA